MEIILVKDVPNLGLKNEIVTVKNGYGENYLIPQGFAIRATESAKKQHAETMKQRAHKEEKIKNEAMEMASKLESVSLTIATKASATGKIFGSVNAIQVSDCFERDFNQRTWFIFLQNHTLQRYRCKRSFRSCCRIIQKIERPRLLRSSFCPIV